MSQFEYTLPSGARFKVFAPAGSTQVDADRVFYEQVAAGSLVSYEAGQTLTSVATRLTKFELSRLDRGTAGVDNIAILSIVQNLPVISGIPDLVNTPVQSPINQTDIVLARGDSLGPTAVGPLTAFQVQTLQAQLINLVDQDYTQISLDKGIGKYGLTCLQLEQIGYVKPGTYARFIAPSPEDFECVMNSPAIWTGLGGSNSLDDLLNDADLQNTIQNQLMQSAYQALTATGVISNVPRSQVSINQGQIYTASGLQTLNALNVLGGTSGLVSNLLSQPVSELRTISSGAVPNTAVAQASINITNRITGEVGALISNASKFGSISTTAWANSGGVPSIGSLLTGAGNFPTLSSLNVNQLTAGLTNVVPPNLGNLKANLDNFGKSSQFALNFTNPLPSLNVSNLQGQLTGAVGNLQGQLAGGVGRLTNLFSGSGDLVSGTQVAAGFNNTVNRKTVDAAVTRILGNSKIPTPGFEYPSAESLAQKLDVLQAQNILQNIKQQGSQVLNQATQLQSQATRLAGQATFNRLTG